MCGFDRPPPESLGCLKWVHVGPLKGGEVPLCNFCRTLWYPKGDKVVSCVRATEVDEFNLAVAFIPTPRTGEEADRDVMP